MLEDGYSGGRVTTSSPWPTYFIEKLDPWSPRAAIDGYITTDRQGDTSRGGKVKWVKTGSVGLVKGPPNRMSNLYACSLWKLMDPTNGGGVGLGDYNYYLRISTYPDSGSAKSNQLFRKYNAVKDNNYPVISLTKYRELKSLRDQAVQGLGGRGNAGNSASTTNPAGALYGSADTQERLSGANLPYLPSDAYSTYLNGNKNSGTGGGTGGGGGSSGTNDTDSSTAYAMDSAVRLIVRMPIGYAGVAKSESRSPGFIQTWKEDDGNIYTEEFLFRYIPQNVKYDGLSSEWVEIPRAENIPFVDWARWPLMKVSMSFIIASDRIEPGGQSVPDGMSIAVEPQIQKLRQMAQRKVPITFINMDELLTVQLRRGTNLGRGLEFVINDMSVTATRRVTDFTNGSASVPSGISVAQIEMTFTEVPVERVSVVYLAPIGAPAIPPPVTTTPGGGPVEYARLSLVATGGPNRVTATYTDDAAT